MHRNPISCFQFSLKKENTQSFVKTSICMPFWWTPTPCSFSIYYLASIVISAVLGCFIFQMYSDLYLIFAFILCQHFCQLHVGFSRHQFLQFFDCTLSQPANQTQNMLHCWNHEEGSEQVSTSLEVTYPQPKNKTRSSAAISSVGSATKSENKIKFSRNNRFKCSPWTRKNQYREHRPKFFAQSPKQLNVVVFQFHCCLPWWQIKTRKLHWYKMAIFIIPRFVPL